MSKLKVFEEGRTKTAIYQPGNGTRYEVVVSPRADYEHHWIASFPLMGVCMEIAEGTYLAAGYAQEKMRYNRRGYEISMTDLGEMIKVILLLIPNVTGDRITDEEGFLLAS